MDNASFIASQLAGEGERRCGAWGATWGHPIEPGCWRGSPRLPSGSPTWFAEKYTH